MDNNIPTVFLQLKPYLQEILKNKDLASLNVDIVCRTLTPEEALGNPGRNDFPLQKGKESLMQAEIGNHTGQAYTDTPGNMSGTLKDILTLHPINNYNRAAIVATLNAHMCSIGEITATIHCKDAEPKQCSVELVEHISRQYGRPRIVMIGLQPAMADTLSENFPLRVLDLDPQNAGKKFNNTVVEDANYSLQELENWCDLFLVTGSTVVNGSIDPFLERKKPVIFYGTTIAGPAKILGLTRFCSRAT